MTKKINEPAARDRLSGGEEINIIETAIRAGEQLAVGVIANPVQDGKPFVVLRGADGEQTVKFLDERFTAPARATAAVKLNDEASFVAHWKKHSTPTSTIYATVDPARFVAVFDDNAKDAPAFREHRASYTLKPSAEWQAWTGRSRQPFDGNEKFALWLEDQVPDVVKPDGARLLEIALNFRMNQNAAFANALRLQDGNTEFTFTNAADANSRVGSGKVKIPEEFTIEIPVFDGLNAKKYRIDARFRFRLGDGGKLTLWFELIRPQKVQEAAFKELVESIQRETKAPVLFGSPE